MLLLRCWQRPGKVTKNPGLHRFVGCQTRVSIAMNYIAGTDITEYPSDEQVQDKPGANDFHGTANAIRVNCMKGRSREAIAFLNSMKPHVFAGDSAAHVALLQECIKLKSLAEGKQVHLCIIKAGLQLDVFLLNNILNMYAKCGSLDDARQMFDKMPKRTVVSWNAVIAGYIQNGEDRKALELFCEMRKELWLRQTSYTFASVFKVCARLVDLEIGKQVHGVIIRSGVDLDVCGRIALVDMYAKCGCIEDARQVFDEMLERDVVLWTAMIAGYVQHGLSEKALQLFEEMLEEGVSVNQFTIASVLSACAVGEYLEKGQQVHGKLVKTGSKPDAFVASALVDMYAKCGNLEDAHKVFDRMGKGDEVFWTALITGYVQHGFDNEAFQLFKEMQCAGMKPNQFTFASVLRACVSLMALERGRQAHAHIIKVGFELNLFAGNTLVDMYSKCGSIEDAKDAFYKIPKPNVVSWNAMITGCAQHGMGQEVLKLFQEMQLEGIQPDHITFVGVLSACSRAGLVDEGRRYFNSMSSNYGVDTRLEHCACMVDILGRAGLLDEAECFIKTMFLQPNALIWRTLLGACRVHGNVELGERVAKCLLMLEPHHAGTYVLLSNMYASAGRWDQRTEIRNMMKEMKVRKDPGCSWINIRNREHTFVMGDRSHPQTDEIYTHLESLTRQTKEAGYVPDTDIVMHDIEEENKETLIGEHSERLAIVFGLMSTFSGTPIRVFKNLRVCGDCHNATKLISKIAAREIIMRDANRFHHFKGGLCSCGDYW